MPYKLFSTGEVLTASNVNSLLMNQTVMVFADSAARTTALSGVLAAGMVTYLTGTNSLETYNGSSWTANGTGDVTLTGTQTLTNKTLTLPVINNFILGYSTTATAAGTTTLTNSSNNQQLFTGTTTQTVVMPVASTMTVGTRFLIENNSTGIVTAQSSGGNTIVAIPSNMSVKITSILNSGTTAASWDFEYVGFNAITGTGSAVFATSPTITAPLINLAFNAQTGTTYTLVAADSGKLVTSSNAASVVITVPPSVFAVGEQINVASIGVGLTSFAAGSGVTITSTGATATAPILRARYSAATVICTASNTFLIVGDLS